MLTQKCQRVTDDLACAGIVIAHVEGVVAGRVVQHVERHVGGERSAHEGVEERIERRIVLARPRDKQWERRRAAFLYGGDRREPRQGCGGDSSRYTLR